MIDSRFKRPALLVLFCFAVVCTFFLRRTNVVIPSRSFTATEVEALSTGLGQRLPSEDGWKGVAGEYHVPFRAIRRLTGGISPPAPPGHPYFTDDESTPIIDGESSPEHGHGHAWHKPLHPIDGWDIAGVALACIGLMIAAAGGIGGGGILVPLYILVLGFDPKHAIPLSNITIFGGAITNTLLNLSKRHPDADRPLVDWDLILVMEPLTIGGALVGSFINKVRWVVRIDRQTSDVSFLCPCFKCYACLYIFVFRDIHMRFESMLYWALLQDNCPLLFPARHMKVYLGKSVKRKSASGRH